MYMQFSNLYLAVVYVQSDDELIQAALLNMLSAETKELAIKDVMCSEISQVVENLQKKDEKVTGSLEEAKISLETVEDQLQRLKSEHEKLMKMRERKNKHKEWLKNEKKARYREDRVMQEMIADTEEAVAELSQKIISLEGKIDASRQDRELLNEKLLKQEVDKKRLEKELGEKQEELESVKRETEMQRKDLEGKIDQLTRELFENKVKTSLKPFNILYICMYKLYRKLGSIA